MWMDNFILNLPREFWPKFGPMQSPCLFRFFESKASVVVLSASNKAEIETNTTACAANKVPILKRKGGGGCVVLGPGCLILTFAFDAQNVFGNKEYFNQINHLWIDALKAVGVTNIAQNGISDICIKDKKIVGTSIFRKKHLLVYQGSLLVDPNMVLINQLLKYPSRAPEYREGRSHEGFLTSLKAEGYDFKMTALTLHCQKYFEANLEKCLKNSFLKY